MLNRLFNTVDRNKYISAFGFLLVCKIILFFWFVSYQSPSMEGSYIEIPADDEGYLTTVENLIKKGVWYYDRLSMEAPRVPGQSLTYGLFRYFTSIPLAINLLILFQIAVYSATFTLLSKVLSDIFKRKYIFWISVLLFGIEFYHSIWSHYVTLSESLGNSYLVLSLCFLYYYIEGKARKYLFLSGLFGALCFFFKVTNIVVLGVLGIWLLVHLVKEKSKLSSIVRLCFLFSLPFIVLESIWVVRNYNATSKFIPLQQIKGFPINVSNNSENPMKECVSFVKSFGGNWVKWNPKSEMAWFNSVAYNTENGFKVESNIIEVFPDWIFTDKLDSNYLKEAKLVWNASKQQGIQESEKLNLEFKAAGILGEFKQNIIQNHAVQYHLLSRLKCFKDFFLHTGTYYFPYGFGEVGLVGKLIKISQMLLYYTLLLLGTFGILSFYFSKKTKHPFFYIASIIIIGFSFLYCGVFRTNELRYNSTIFILLIIFSIYKIDLLIKLKQDK